MGLNFLTPEYFIKAIQYVAGGLSVLGISLEFLPVKVSPISSIFKWIGKNINSSFSKELKEIKDDFSNRLTLIEEKMVTMEEQIDENEVERLRSEILDFANSCRYQRKHSKDEFSHIIKSVDRYHKILDKRNEKNGQIDLDYEFIQDTYSKCLNDNSFI